MFSFPGRQIPNRQSSVFPQILTAQFVAETQTCFFGRMLIHICSEKVCKTRLQRKRIVSAAMPWQNKTGDYGNGSTRQLPRFSPSEKKKPQKTQLNTNKVCWTPSCVSVKQSTDVLSNILMNYYRFSPEILKDSEGTKADWKDFSQKPRFFCSPPSFIFLSPCTSFLSRSHSEPNCHENELLICSPKEFLMPRGPDSRNTTLVMWSTNNFPGLHCLSKTLSPADADHVRNDLVKGRPAFIPAQRCQMGRVRTSKHVNPRPPPPTHTSPRHSWSSEQEVSPQSTFQSTQFDCQQVNWRVLRWNSSETPGGWRLSRLPLCWIWGPAFLLAQHCCYYQFYFDGTVQINWLRKQRLQIMAATKNVFLPSINRLTA